MRYLIILLCLATPAHAWDFTPGTPCLLTHETAAFQMELTYDPVAPLYSITVTLPDPWPDAPSFGMRFDGPQGRVIGTDQHQLSNDGRSLTVTDRGFGNVLDGLQFNHTATAQSGDISVTFPLDGAAEPVEAFRKCEALGFSS
ncbi:MAG: hypothetical protein AAFZ04_06115 [Pseudomonadota bacterium]